MKGWRAAILIPLFVAGCSRGIEAAPAPSLDPAFDRIDTMTDCNALQHEFDVASRKLHALPQGSKEAVLQLDLESAAYTRMKTIGCFGATSS